ncbi:GNAT family N-acetyltransferase [Streptomyces sp. NPDC060194]|uniref:GNAT family N-acetyltransferase n=1 Tax=Streptomyces sp. NPDC060194 TaxID=3347069 RepID=UPI003655FCC5
MPAPYAVRPATLADAPEIHGLLALIDEFEVGRSETDLSTVESDLKHPEADLPHNSWLLHAPDGTLAAYGNLWDDSGAEDINVDHYVRPGHEGAGHQLLGLLEARAIDKARGNGAERAVAHLYYNAHKATFDVAAHLPPRGWRTVRRYNVLTRDVTSAERPAPPPGLTLRDCTAEADRRRAHALWSTTFAEHHGHHPRTYEQWLADLDPELIDWKLVTIATLDLGHGPEDVGVLVARDDRSAMGWVSSLGTVREARGRGVGGFLLRHAFAEFAARGRTVMGLGVDTSNETNPLRLYEAHGMRTHFAVDTWEAVFPVHG